MRIVQLDILRAVAVLMVLGAHMGPAPDDANPFVSFISHGWRQLGGLGVDLFFVLSGFLVSGLLFREYKDRGAINLKRFLIRRGLKIYPAFYVFLAITVALRLERGDTITSNQMLCEAFFVQNYGPHVWSHTWSLAVEEHFYLLLALLFGVLVAARPMKPFRPIVGIFLATATFVFAARALTYWLLPFSNDTHLFQTHLRIDALLFGVVLAYFYNLKPESLRFIAQNKLATLCFAGASLVLGLFVLSDASRYLAGHILVYLGFGGVLMALMYATFPDSGLFGRSASFVGFVGSHSYSIYLWHTAVLVFGLILARKLLGSEPSYYLVFPAYMTATIVFGILMARCVEIPVLRIRERLFPAKGEARAVIGKALAVDA